MTSIKMLGNSELGADVLRRDPKPISEQNMHEYGTVFETTSKMVASFAAKRVIIYTS